VATPHGLVAIASLHVGDAVLAEDPSAHRVDAEPVRAVIDDGIKPLLRVGLSDGTSLSVTTNHPFYADASAVRPRAGWVEAGGLRVGDRLRTEGGRDVTVVALRYHTGYAHVYTLTVAHDHDFFVGAAGVLVHNTQNLRPRRVITGNFPLTGAQPYEVLIRYDQGAGTINHYAVYDENGNILYRVDLVGPPHNGVSTPHVHYYHINIDPQGRAHPQEFEDLAYPAGQHQLTPPLYYCV
jgi:hypothetical protein